MLTMMSEWPSPITAAEIREALARHHARHAAASVRTPSAEARLAAIEADFDRQAEEKEQRRMYLQDKYGDAHSMREGAPDMWYDPTFEYYDAAERRGEARSRMTPLEYKQDELAEVREQLDEQYRRLNRNSVNEKRTPWPEQEIEVLRVAEARLVAEIARAQQAAMRDHI